MIGALLAGIAYRSFRNVYAAGAGEVIGTGLLGALASAWIVGPMLIGKAMPMTVLIVAFSVSTLAGSILGIAALHLLKKVGVWEP
jgi:energy coupling factor transporter S component ThiW